jgi:hypothetical protein
MAKSRSKPGGIGAKGSACARFFHPGQNIRDQWPNTHRTHRVSDALVVGKGIYRVQKKDQLCYECRIPDIDDNTIFHIVCRNFKVEDAAATPFDDERPLEAVVTVPNAQEIDEVINNELRVSESDVVPNVRAGGGDRWPRRSQNSVSRG